MVLRKQSRSVVREEMFFRLGRGSTLRGTRAMVNESLRILMKVKELKARCRSCCLVDSTPPRPALICSAGRPLLPPRRRRPPSRCGNNTTETYLSTCPQMREALQTTTQQALKPLEHWVLLFRTLRPLQIPPSAYRPSSSPQQARYHEILCDTSTQLAHL